MRFQLPKTNEYTPLFGNAFTRFFGAAALKILGWQISGELPKQKKVVVAAFPHTSNWDFVIAMLAMLAVGVKLSYLMKKEAFFWPFKGLFVKFGGIPLDRSASEGVVEQVAQWFTSHEKLWVAITPEGTRAKVDKYKTGFLRIAALAQVPVYMVIWDYPSKTLVLAKSWPLTGEHEADAEAIRKHVNDHYKGRWPEKQ